MRIKKLNFLLVDDETLLREGLRSLLIQEDFVQTIYQASNAEEFHRQLTMRAIDIVLLDFRLQDTNGIALMESLKKMSVQPKVIGLTGLEGVELIINLLRSGVHGIVFKLDGYREIIKTIRGVLKDGHYFPDKIVKIIQANAHRWDNVPPVVLNFQEKELLKGLSTGLTTKEIATALKMSEGTTETYRVRLIKKIGVSNTAALLAYAYRNGIL